jgi:tetratricopeptide (TPR) repeat protein
MNRLHFLISIIFFAGCETSDIRKQRLLLKGNKALEYQQYEEAIRQYEAALKLDSCYADAWNNWGTALHRQRLYAEAVEKYNQAISCRPDELGLRLNRANSYFELKQLQKALEDVTHVLNRKDTLPAHFLLGLIYARLGEYDKAVASYRKVLGSDPSHREGRINLGTSLYYAGAYDSARLVLESVVRDHPTESMAWNALALVAAEEGKGDEAEKYINQALYHRPQDAWFLNNRGYVYLMNNKLEEGLADIQASIAADPYNAWAYRNKGIYYLMKKEPQEALRYFQDALRRDSLVEDGYALMAEAYHQLNRKEEACRALAQSRRRSEKRKVKFTCKI